MIKCSFCGYNFEEETGIEECKGCPMSKNCGKLKCPNCNFENLKPIKFNQKKRTGEGKL